VPPGAGDGDGAEDGDQEHEGDGSKAKLYWVSSFTPMVSTEPLDWLRASVGQSPQRPRRASDQKMAPATIAVAADGEPVGDAADLAGGFPGLG
jgi:hypothetical protein